MKQSDSILRLRIRALTSALAGPFDFEIAAGRCSLIGGPSGSGKSLFLRMIADLDPNEGRVELDGVERGSIAAPEWRRRVPYVAANSGWWLDRVADHFAPPERKAALTLADRLGLRDHQFDGPVQRLSTGERQRLALIRGLVLKTSALLLDEPTSALDPEATEAVEAVLKERMASGAAIVMVSHDVGQAERMNAARYQMMNGKLSAVT
jgi:putative ABC transport system ATP-binding protein